MLFRSNNLADPADLKYDDWFELYNAGDSAVNLAGYYLTDNLANRTQYQIPPGYSLLAKGYLLVWADNQTNENSAARIDLHVNFQLAKSGEAIGLFAPDGTTAVDFVLFGAQTNDVSQGRCPDGAANIVYLPSPSPRGANSCAPAAPAFASVTLAGNGSLALEFPTVNGKLYRVEYKNDLSDPQTPWLPLGGNRPGTGANLTVSDTLGPQPQRFYRLVLLN